MDLGPVECAKRLADKKNMSDTNEKLIRRRRVPRRDFLGRVGILVDGQYQMSRALQIGEGGMLLYSTSPLSVNQQLVVTFRVPGHNPDVVRAVVRYVMAPQAGMRERYGVEFTNLDFKVKRDIRNYVATQSRAKTNGPIAN